MNKNQEIFYSVSHRPKRELLNHGMALLGQSVSKDRLQSLIDKYNQNEKDDYSYDTLFHYLMDELEAMVNEGEVQ
jgi:hypothetical protein